MTALAGNERFELKFAPQFRDHVQSIKDADNSFLAKINPGNIIKGVPVLFDVPETGSTCASRRTWIRSQRPRPLRPSGAGAGCWRG